MSDETTFKGPLKDCPSSPNCVCTQATSVTAQMPAMKFEGSAAEAIQRVRKYLEKQPRCSIKSTKPNYLHAVFVTALMRFRDDVEFYADSETSTLHFRSASRLGYSDLGANRKRMLKITKDLSANGFQAIS